MNRALKLRKPDSIEGLEAVIAMADKRYEDALKHFAAARDFLARRRFDSGLARLAKERIVESESECLLAIEAAKVAIQTH
jgi:hypothetical protein